jgi:hypothetical protein
VELRAAAQKLQRSEATALVLALRPQLDGAADRPGGVLVGVHLAEPPGRGQQARTGTVAFAGGEPLLGNRLGCRTAPRQLLGQPPVAGTPSGPRRVVIDGLADEGVAERALLAHLHQEAPLDRFVDAVGAAQRGQQLQVESEPGRGGDLKGVAPGR